MAHLMDKIKMLVIGTTFQTCGGVERFLLNFLNVFSRDKYEIDLLLFDNLQDEAEMFDAIPPGINILPHLWQYSRFTPELMDFLCENGLREAAGVRRFVYHRNNNDLEFRKMPMGDRLIANWELLKTICPYYEGYDYAVAFRNGLPLNILDCNVSAKTKCCFVHTDIKLQSELDENTKSTILSQYEYYKNIDRIVCVTEQNAKSYKDVFPRLADKVSVLVNVSNVRDIVSKSMSYFPCEYKKNEFNILTIARVEKEKNTMLLLQSANELRKRGLPFKWYVLGRIADTEYTRECMETHKRLNLIESVEFLSEIANPFPYYTNCSLFVMTSRFEGRSIAIEEAMILGCSIVSTNFASIYDQITDKINGRICEMTPESVADVIEELYNDELQRQRIAKANAGYMGDSAKSEYFKFFC